MSVLSTVRWLAAIAGWGASWTFLVIGLVTDDLQWIGVSILLAVCGATVLSWVIAENIAGTIAGRIVVEERIRVEDLAASVARVLVQEYKLGRIPPQ